MIEPYYEEPNITIYCGDCLEIMPQILDKSIDLVVTSPPYNVGIKYEDYNNNKPEKEYWDFTKKWIFEIYEIMRIGGRICINIPVMGNNPLMKKSNLYLFHLPEYLNVIREKFHLRENITWIKSYAEYDENVFCGGSTSWGSWLSPSSPFCRSFSEFIIVAHKDTPKLQHKGKTDLTKEEFLRFSKNVWFFPTEPDRSHPAPFPKQLPYRCIKFYSWIGDTVLDPFMGSGATLVVCKEFNRKGIGIEISKKYCDMAVQRLRNTTLSLL